MKKLIILHVLFLYSTFSYCQLDNSVKNYQIGSKALEDKRYSEAISFLSLSIDDNPTANAYFNRAVSYLNIGDSCAFCSDLQNAMMFYDEEASKLYDKKCIVFDTLIYTADSIFEEFPGYSYTIRKRTICSETGSYKYFDAKGKSIESIYDVFPEFPGGDKARNHFLAENLIYPQQATENGTQGIVYISFYIETDGTISEIKAIRSPSKALSAETIRTVKLMPKWKPGTRKGKPVRVQFNMPVYFKLQG
jgi:periplasmic protein TonB